MDNIVQNIYQNLLKDLTELPELKKVGVKNPVVVGDRVRSSIAALKTHFKSNPFQDNLKEIHFFKYEKPAIISEFIYAQELYTIASNRPLADRELTDAYYARELSFIKRFFDQYRVLYQYFQLDGTEFEELYFLRAGRPVEVTVPVAPDFDPEFSTPGDFLFAKFIAYERLQDYLADTLYTTINAGKSVYGVPMRWTGDVINLVELIYGLNLTGQLNQGNVSLNELVRWAEDLFGVKIGVIQRRFAEIQGRKRIGYTKFLDLMRDNVQQKIDESAA